MARSSRRAPSSIFRRRTRTAAIRAPSSRSPTLSNTGSTSATTLSETASSIEARWRAFGKSRALIPYLTAGFTDFPRSLEAIRRVARAGADFIEVGVPFSDPVADGPTIQRTTQAALEQVMTVPRVLELIRNADVSIPIIIMTYLNPVLSFGMQRFAAEAREAGAAGVLLTDLPAGADPAVEQTVRDNALALIRLVAPTTDDARLKHARSEEHTSELQSPVHLVCRLLL